MMYIYICVCVWYVWYAWYVWLMIVSISIPPSPRHPPSIQIVGDSDLDLAEMEAIKKMEVIPSGYHRKMEVLMGKP